MFFTVCDTPVGPLLVAGDAEALRVIAFPDERRRATPEPDWRRSDDTMRAAAQQIQAYFAGARSGFDLSLEPEGTAFQKRVWQALRSIPFGTTISYGELAARLGKPTASRAVGAANGANPIPIIIPCHRVIGADGSLTGFGGGLHIKRWLLEHEHALPDPARQQELWS